MRGPERKEQLSASSGVRHMLDGILIHLARTTRTRVCNTRVAQVERDT